MCKNSSIKDHNSAQICWTRIISPHALLYQDLWCNIPAKFHLNPCKGVGGVEKTSKMWKNSKCQGPQVCQKLSHMNYLSPPPTYASRPLVQNPCQVSSKSMQGCRRNRKDKLKCIPIQSVKDHNSAKICQTWIISPHAHLDLLCKIPAKCHSNPCKYVWGVERAS